MSSALSSRADRGGLAGVLRGYGKCASNRCVWRWPFKKEMFHCKRYREFARACTESEAVNVGGLCVRMRMCVGVYMESVHGHA